MQPVTLSFRDLFLIDQEDIAAGKTVVSSAAGDSSLTEKTEGSLIRRKEMLLSDLSVLDSTTYPRTQVIAHKRARVRYT